ncbi:hypothetical protein GCM10027589_01870 [Actinocorallia lasiicapitis]
MQPWPQQQPPRPPRHHVPARNLAVAFGTPVLLLLVAAALFLAGRPGAEPGGGGGNGGDGGGDQGDIRRAVTAFSAAVDRNDNVTLLSLLCPAEAVNVEDDIDSPDSTGDPQAPIHPLTIGEIKITGEVAEVTVSRPEQAPATVFLLRQNGAWKLCDPERYGR